MQDDYNDDILENKNFCLQQCVKVEEFYDNEMSYEFFVLAPIDINDMYNQN